MGDSNKNQQGYAKYCKSIAGPTVTFLAHQDKGKVVKLMDEHRCLVIPSLFETYSLVGWEAAARGLSVVANNSADMSESLVSIANLVHIENESDFITAVEAGLKGQKNPKYNLNIILGTIFLKKLMQLIADFPFLFQRSL